jgi:NAD(P)-dependent dehydrogenase (short-subunit alcohol dehydrogenase family)
MAVVGLMNSLGIEGAKNNIKVNTLAPAAATRMTQDVMPPEMLQAIRPEQVTPGALFLVSEEAPNKAILSAGAGVFSAARVVDTAPVHIPDHELSPDAVAARYAQIADWSTARPYDGSLQQVNALIDTALRALKD